MRYNTLDGDTDAMDHFKFTPTEPMRIIIGLQKPEPEVASVSIATT